MQEQDRSRVTPRRLDTSLEAAGAEFLVLGALLVEGVQTFKAYTNFPGYDLIATNPEKNLSCRIQVKSRYATDWDRGFPIKSFDCDFVVVVALNRGYRYGRRSASAADGRREPQMYVLPVEVVRGAMQPSATWSKAYLRNMPDVDDYLGNWSLVKSFLEMEDSES